MTEFLFSALTLFMGCYSPHSATPSLMQLTQRNTTEVEYRLLHKSQSGPSSVVATVVYTISVDEYLTEDDFKDLVCRVLRDQKPRVYCHLGIQFQYRLKAFDGIETKEFAETSLGSYRWTEGASHEFSLGIFVNSNGERVSVEDRLRPFDHTAECPVNE